MLNSGRVTALTICVIVLCQAVRAAEPSTARLGLKALPFTGLVIPHQDISEFGLSAPLGVGLEIYWIPSFSLCLDLSTSWHSDGGDDMQLSSLQVNGRWRFPRQRWTPFVQAGVGGYQAEVDEGRGEEQYGGVGVTFGGGVEVPVWKDLLVQAEVRSNWAKGEATVVTSPPGEETTQTAKREDWIGHTQGLLWIVYKFP